MALHAVWLVAGFRFLVFRGVQLLAVAPAPVPGESHRGARLVRTLFPRLAAIACVMALDPGLQRILHPAFLDHAGVLNGRRGTLGEVGVPKFQP